MNPEDYKSPPIEPHKPPHEMARAILDMKVEGYPSFEKWLETPPDTPGSPKSPTGKSIEGVFADFANALDRLGDMDEWQKEQYAGDEGLLKLMAEYNRQEKAKDRPEEVPVVKKDLWRALMMVLAKQPAFLDDKKLLERAPSYIGSRIAVIKQQLGNIRDTQIIAKPNIEDLTLRLTRQVDDFLAIQRELIAFNRTLGIGREGPHK